MDLSPPRLPPALRAAVLARALAALEAGRFDDAEAAVAGWVRHAPDDSMAGLMLALALAGRGEAVQAAPLLQRVAAARPDCAHPCCDLAKLRADAPELVDAQFRACRALAPDDAKLATAHADFLVDNGDPETAASVLREVVAQAPAFGPAHNILGMALFDHGDVPAALAAFRVATALDPDEAAPWANLGMALKVQGQFDEALAACDRAVACAPADPQIRLNRAVALLRAGRMEQAWPDYEFRLALGRGARLPPATLLPDVSGLDLRGRTVLAWHEEGFGDTLHFCRYLAPLAARGARVLVWVPAELTRLMATVEGVAQVLTSPELPHFDFHCPFFSLPRAFATTIDSIPAPPAYLHADAALAATWAQRLPPRAALRVGLVWAGQARPWAPGFTALDRRRSMSLATLAPLGAVPGASFVSLQKGPPAAEARSQPPGMALHDPMAEATDFADTAGIVANLDVVVSVDTAVAHLAAGMGVPVLLLDRYDSCWRWFAGREDSPWYPSLRILRQQECGDWTPVLRRAAALLADMAPR